MNFTLQTHFNINTDIMSTIQKVVFFLISKPTVEGGVSMESTNDHIKGCLQCADWSNLVSSSAEPYVFLMLTLMRNFVFVGVVPLRSPVSTKWIFRKLKIRRRGGRRLWTPGWACAQPVVWWLIAHRGNKTVPGNPSSGRNTFHEYPVWGH